MDGAVKFNVSANTAQFDAAMGRVGSVAQTTGDRVRAAFSGLGGVLAGGAVLAGLKSVMNEFDRVAKVATRFGASAEEIQRVSVAADLAGTSIDTVARVLTKMSVAASDAGAGNETLAKAFEKAGINAEQFKNAGLDQQLVQLSEAFNRARGDADATNQIIELMGTRAASQMIPLIDNTAALRQEMEGVSVASDDVVRKIEAANDRLTRLGNDGKVALAGLIEGFASTSERLGNVISDQDKLLKLLAALPLALTGNIKPLWEVLQTGKTIAEMEEVEARATAIAQLTREGVFGMDAVKNAELIAERTKQILDQTRGTTQQIQIAEESTDRVLSLEKEKTSELQRQQRVLEQQEARRKEAIKDTQFEIQMIEAKLRGDKERIAALEEQRDFERALEETGSFETAASYSLTRRLERLAAEKEAGQEGSGAASGGGFGFVARSQSALDRLRAAAATDPRARTELLRLQDREARDMARADRQRSGGQFGSAARTQIRAEQRAEASASREMQRQTMQSMFGARNIADSLTNLSKEAFRAGMSLNESMSRMGIDRKTGESREKALERFVKEQSKTEAERKQEAEREDKKSGSGSGESIGGGKTLSDLWAELKELNTKLPQNAMS